MYEGHLLFHIKGEHAEIAWGSFVSAVAGANNRLESQQQKVQE